MKSESETFLQRSDNPPCQNLHSVITSYITNTTKLRSLYDGLRKECEASHEDDIRSRNDEACMLKDRVRLLERQVVLQTETIAFLKDLPTGCAAHQMSLEGVDELAETRSRALEFEWKGKWELREREFKIRESAMGDELQSLKEEVSLLNKYREMYFADRDKITVIQAERDLLQEQLGFLDRTSGETIDRWRIKFEQFSQDMVEIRNMKGDLEIQCHLKAECVCVKEDRIATMQELVESLTRRLGESAGDFHDRVTALEKLHEKRLQQQNTTARDLEEKLHASTESNKVLQELLHKRTSQLKQLFEKLRIFSGRPQFRSDSNSLVDK